MPFTWTPAWKIRPPVLLERPGYLLYVLPCFKAAATVRCRGPRKEAWTVGFLQQIDEMSIRQEYRRATTSWELPRLPAYDCASVASPPWYGALHEIARLEPGEEKRTVEVAMDDNLVGSVTWAEPLPPRGDRLGERPELRAVRRSQAFTTWLVARRESDGHLQVLRKIPWRVDVEIDVDPDRPLGSRASARMKPAPPVKVTDGRGETVPPQCLRGPGANAGQEFWWMPRIEGIGSRTRLSP